MKPGAAARPVASSVGPLGDAGRSGASAGPIRAMRPPSTHMLSFAWVPLAGSMTRPFLMSSMGGSFGIVGFRSGRNHDEEDGHTHGQAIGYLLQDARPGPVRDSRINLQSTNHGAGVKHERSGTGDFETLGRELIKQNVFVQRQGWFMQTFLLDPKNDDRVGPFEGILDPGRAPNLLAQAFKFPGQPHRRATKRETAPQFSREGGNGETHPALAN